ncbi:GNAT family N-acetyltransferase [Sphingomonas sp. AR_OL41]|uniref:GNAT family N-acetyltransferase n=1 Tax=Sphingomonas sp. AR_OL41 TaxID=3042729 RepID=UPI0024805BD6|nr:GNAT family N-acetyltransferase [Sphingomonas sp. AR_OL41]MDH7971100.1 GNAT family N-acetyltransferase [Sphingomonas sp. AR_OL41]
MGRGAAGDAQLSAPGWRIVRDDLTHPQVIALIELHLRSAFENSPPGAVFALDLSGLRDPAVSLWTAWEGANLLGMGALKRLDDSHGEIKSMRTAPAQLRRGVAGFMLDHLLTQARGQGYRRISLETGSTDAFAPARALYERTGFTETGPFADYTDTGFSRYYTMELN